MVAKGFTIEITWVDPPIGNRHTEDLRHLNFLDSFRIKADQDCYVLAVPSRGGDLGMYSCIRITRSGGRHHTYVDARKQVIKTGHVTGLTIERREEL